MNKGKALMKDKKNHLLYHDKVREVLTMAGLYIPQSMLDTAMGDLDSLLEEEYLNLLRGVFGKYFKDCASIVKPRDDFDVIIWYDLGGELPTFLIINKLLGVPIATEFSCVELQGARQLTIKLPQFQVRNESDIMPLDRFVGFKFSQCP